MPGTFEKNIVYTVLKYYHQCMRILQMIPNKLRLSYQRFIFKLHYMQSTTHILLTFETKSLAWDLVINGEEKEIQNTLTIK